MSWCLHRLCNLISNLQHAYNTFNIICCINVSGLISINNFHIAVKNTLATLGIIQLRLYAYIRLYKAENPIFYRHRLIDEAQFGVMAGYYHIPVVVNVG